MKADDLCGVSDEAVGELRDVDESVLMNTDVDEGSEVGNVCHDTGEFHTYDEVVEGMDILVEFEDFNLSTWVTPWFLKFGEDVAEGNLPQPLRKEGECLCAHKRVRTFLIYLHLSANRFQHSPSPFGEGAGG